MDFFLVFFDPVQILLLVSDLILTGPGDLLVLDHNTTISTKSQSLLPGCCYDLVLKKTKTFSFGS
jgi:hypothetical protein